MRRKVTSKATAEAFESWFGDAFESSGSSNVKASDRLKEAQRKVDRKNEKKKKRTSVVARPRFKKKITKSKKMKRKSEPPKAFRRLEHALKSQTCPGMFCLNNNERETNYVVKYKHIYRLKARREGRKTLSSMEKRRMYDDAHVCKACYDGYTKLVLMDESIPDESNKRRPRRKKLLSFLPSFLPFVSTERNNLRETLKRNGNFFWREH